MECDELPQMRSSTFFALIYLVKIATLVMSPEERWSAQDILKQAEPELSETIFEEENFDPASETVIEDQANPNGFFEPSPFETWNVGGSGRVCERTS